MGSQRVRLNLATEHAHRCSTDSAESISCIHVTYAHPLEYSALWRTFLTRPEFLQLWGLISLLALWPPPHTCHTRHPALGHLSSCGICQGSPARSCGRSIVLSDENLDRTLAAAGVTHPHVTRSFESHPRADSLAGC